MTLTGYDTLATLPWIDHLSIQMTNNRFGNITASVQYR